MCVCAGEMFGCLRPASLRGEGGSAVREMGLAVR